jgi:hypothetical protein
MSAEHPQEGLSERVFSAFDRIAINYGPQTTLVGSLLLGKGLIASFVPPEGDSCDLIVRGSIFFAIGVVMTNGPEWRAALNQRAANFFIE